jgi:hypothetical protein
MAKGEPFHAPSFELRPHMLAGRSGYNLLGRSPSRDGYRSAILVSSPAEGKCHHAARSITIDRARVSLSTSPPPPPPPVVVRAANDVPSSRKEG